MATGQPQLVQVTPGQSVPAQQTRSELLGDQGRDGDTDRREETGGPIVSVDPHRSARMIVRPVLRSWCPHGR
jgi:hypothetical protein